MSVGIDGFIALERELSQKLETQIDSFQNRKLYGDMTIRLFSGLTFLILATVSSSLFQQISTDIQNAFPTITLLNEFPLLGGFIAILAFGLFMLANLWLVGKLDIHQRPYWVWWIWLYGTVSLFVLVVMAYETRPFAVESYLPQVVVWFVFSMVLLGASWVFTQFCAMFMPRVAWLWLLSVAPPISHSNALSGYIQLLQTATQKLATIEGWNREMWERIHAIATTRLTATNAHTQTASFILATIAFIGILPTIAERAWQAFMALGEGYFRSFAQTPTAPDAELWVQSVIVLMVVVMVFFTLRYFALEAWHLRLTEMILYLADEHLRDIPQPPPPDLPPPSATSDSASLSSFLVGVGITAIIVGVLGRMRV